MFIENYYQKEPQQIRSKIKRRCKVKSVSELYKDGSMFQKPKFLLSHFLQIDYESETLPHEFQIKDIETYGAFNEYEMKNIFSKTITRDSLQKIMIDAMKLCYLYHPIMQAIQTELKSTKEQYKIKDIINLIYKGSFYQFLTFKTQPAKYLISNRNTEINVKTVVSGIFALVANRLTIQNISDTILFYRLQEALYETSPHGLPFQFNKIIKAMKKIDRNITAENFNKWQRKMVQTEPNIKFLQPYHFVYLISLSQSIKKKSNIFEVDKKQSKFEKQTQFLNVIKQKDNFIDFKRKEVDWRDQIKVRGLSFQQKSKIQKIDFLEKQYDDIKKKISHKRVKSAHVTSQAISMVKQDLRKSNQKENQYLLDTFLMKSRFRKQNQRTLLKKCNKKLTIKKQFESKKIHEEQTFKAFYEHQLANHLVQTPQLKNNNVNPIQPSIFISQIHANQINSEQNQGNFGLDMFEPKMSGFFQKNKRPILQRNSSMSFKKLKPNLKQFKRIHHKNEI